MSKTMKIEVITPEKEFFAGEVESLIVKTLEGYEGFLPGHSWTVDLLDEGVMTIREPGKEPRKANIAKGYIDVKDFILVFTDEANWIDNAK